MRGYQFVSSLLEEGVVEKWKPMHVDEVKEIPPIDNSSFKILAGLEIIDLRSWDPSVKKQDEEVHTFGSLRVGLRKINSINQNQNFTVRLETSSQNIDFRVHNKEFKPTLKRYKEHSATTGKVTYVWDIIFDLEKLPLETIAYIVIEQYWHEGVTLP